MIRKLADITYGLEGLSYLLTAVVGVGCLGYVTVTWVLHWIRNGQYLIAMATALCVVTVSVFAAVRVPVALWLFFGTAALLGTAFLMGAGNVVLP